MLTFSVSISRPSLSVVGEGVLKAGITTLMGPSGSGKSTLMKALAGLVKPDSGHIFLEDTTWYDSERKIHLPPQKRLVGYMPQGAILFPHMTVKENICYSHGGDKELYEQIMESFSLAPYAAMPAYSLSGGEQQRVALGRALYAKPKVLLLDEPFSALDEDLRLQLGQDMLFVVKEWHIPCLWITHSKEDGAIGSHRWCMKKGQLYTET